MKVWDAMYLYWNLPAGELRLNGRQFEHEEAPGYVYGEDKGFTERISSQLLLYRIVVMFGMIPPQQEGYEGRYKSCWECMLRHKDGTSRFTAFDYKGGATLKFKGSAEGSADAMELLNFLCGDAIPHSYDGILAGTMA